MSFNIQSLTQKAEVRLFSEIRKARNSSTLSARDLLIENNQQRLFERNKDSTRTYDIFLSHRSKDANVILGLLDSLNNYGYSVYVDWKEDPQLDRSNINKATSETLKKRMNESKCLLYATTKHAGESKWMPWELGYMDGKKDKAAILPIFQNDDTSTGDYVGQEYLGIYPYAIEAETTKGINKIWICESSDIYTSFDKWLTGKKPYSH